LDGVSPELVVEIDPIASLRLTAVRGKWIDQSQSHNVFLRGSSGRQLDEVYRTAWRMGLKTTYYLHSLAASQIEVRPHPETKLREPGR
jgi:ribonucleoside-diphosphate reductase alpha chain